MKAVFDTSTLIFLLKPDAAAPFIAGTKERVSHCPERISYLLLEMQKAKAGIIIPTPVIAELMVLAGAAGPEWLRILTSTRHFRPVPFDTIAAVECAAMSIKRLGAGKLSEAAKAKAKFDEQIVAIARIEGAQIIYSDDGDIRRLAEPGIKVVGVEDLDLPPAEAQGHLALEARAEALAPDSEDDG